MGLTVLIVDDSRTIRQQVGFTLTKEGFSVLEAEDGDEALAKLKGTQVSLVISDVNMPKMNGFELVEAIRKLEGYKFVPIIMLTTESGGEMVGRGKQAGASGWLVKPFNPEQLVTAVKKLAR